MHAHVGFLARGQVHIQYADGCTVEFAAPQVVVIEPGYDGWVVGDEAAVLTEFDFEGETVSKLGMPEAHRGTAHRRRRRLRAILQPRTALPGRRGGAATWRRCTGRPQIPGTPEALSGRCRGARQSRRRAGQAGALRRSYRTIPRRARQERQCGSPAESGAGVLQEGRATRSGATAQHAAG